MKVVIIHHASAEPSVTPYLIGHICREWLQRGHEVSHVYGLPEPMPVADVAILHVNLTVVPKEYIHAVKDFPVVINRNVVDISKTIFSENIIRPDEAYNGPVIVKTRDNYGGLPERKILSNQRNYLCWGSLFRSWGRVRWLKDYPVYESVEDVPDGIWGNQYLIVEKFLPEHGLDGAFRVREWVFLGNQDIHFVSNSSEPVIKSWNTRSREYLSAGDVPLELRNIRKEFGFDYGKFDYAIHNGKPVLFDINKTPGAPQNLSDRPGAYDRIRVLSHGLESHV